jgi:hypothetical protein
MSTTTSYSTDNLSARSPGRRRRTTRYVLTAAAVAIAGVSALTVTGNARHDQTRFTVDGIRKLVIDQDAGNVTLVPDAAAGHLQATTTRRWAWPEPVSDRIARDGVLTLTGNCPDFPRLGPCAIDRRVSVPRGVAVEIHISAGNINAAGLSLTDFGVDTDSGGIDATDMDVTAFSAETGAGSIRAILSGTPQRVNATTSSGDIRLAVPDRPYRVDAGTSAGQVRIGIAEDPAASRFVTAHTSSGDVILARR